MVWGKEVYFMFLIGLLIGGLIVIVRFFLSLIFPKKEKKVRVSNPLTITLGVIAGIILSFVDRK